jgi:outer membrane protein
MTKQGRRILMAAAFAVVASGGAMADGMPSRYVAPVEPFANFQIKLGVSGVLWQDSNNGVVLSGSGPIAGADAHAQDVWLPTATLTYYFSRNIAAELFCCFAHASVYGDGALKTLGQDKLANTWAFPPVLTLQYRFDHMGAFKPYVGAGVQWIHYFDSKSDMTGALVGFNGVKFRDRWGPALQAGFDFDLGRGWSFGFDAKYVWEDTRITWTDAANNTITTKHDLDPLILTANIGYRFNLEDLFGRRSYAPLK